MPIDYIPYTSSQCISNLIDANILISALRARIEELRLNENELKEQIRDLENRVEELEHLTTIDPLTGVYNRRFLDGYLEQLKQDVCRDSERRLYIAKNFSIFLIDIDDFKTINDTNTHVVGDDAIKYVASTISSALRQSDIYGRFGGDEFLVIAQNTILINECNLAIRVKEKVKEANDQNITISIGVAEYWKGESVGELIARASSAVNEKHARGRDSVYANVGYIKSTGAYINYKL